MKHIAILISENCLATSITGPIDVFQIANSIWRYQAGEQAEALFKISLVSANGEPVTSSAGIQINAECALSELQHCDFLLVTAYHYQSERKLIEFVEQQRNYHAELRQLHHSGVPIGAFCSGTFVLADSGLLNDNIATTSWWLQRLFKKQFPKVKLDLQQRIVVQNNLWTGGATTSYIHLCLKIIKENYGQQIASLVAKVMLVDNNQLSQMPYMVLSDTAQHSDTVISKCQEWIQANLSNSISLEDMSDKSAMSKRNFIRRFKKAVGETPATYLQRLRIESAKRFLETTSLSLEQIIGKVGYEDSSAFRRVFQKMTSLSPKAYRNKFTIQAQLARNNTD